MRKSEKPSSVASKENILLKASTPKISPHKYIRRGFIFNRDQGESLIKLNVKRFHIKKMTDVDKILGSDGDQLDRNQMKSLRKCLRKGHFKTLASLRICSSFHNYMLEELKASKRLTKLRCEPYIYSYPKPIIKFFKRISKRLEEINFSMGYCSDSWEEDSFRGPLNAIKLGEGNALRQLSKAIGSFPRLKIYQGEEKTRANDQMETQEWKHLYRYLKRLSHLQEYDCLLSDRYTTHIWSLLEENNMYPKVTKVRVNLSHLFDPFKDPRNNCAHNLFYVFPNLKQLEFTDDGETYHQCHPLAAQGLKNLQSLQKLSLKLGSSRYDHQRGDDSVVLKGLLDLPKLSSLSLQIFTLYPDQWETLFKFLQNQTDLVSLSLSGEFISKFFVDNLLICLKMMFKLRYLNLDPKWWSSEYICRGMRSLVGSILLKNFELHGFAYKVSSKKTEQHPFENICQFLLGNKDMLSELKLNLPLMVDQKLSTTISQLSYVRKLWLTFSVWKSAEKGEEKGDPDINSVLLKLENLEDLTLDFLSLASLTLEERKWMKSLFNVLPSLKRLRNLEFTLPDKGLSQSELNHIQDAIKQLGHLNTLNFIGQNPQSLDDNGRKALESIKNLGLKKATHVTFPF